MEKDYSQMLCEAVDYLIDAKLENISYDTTILCIIEDDSRADEGIYTVSYGSTKYEAISKDTKYKKGMNVYVQIPQGDWTEQKIIISQKALKDSTPITYTEPFDNFADITANLISVPQGSYDGLIANDPGANFQGIKRTEIPIGYLVPETSRNDSVLEQKGYRKLGCIGGTGLSDFTRLGISADFKSMLGQYQIVSGEYGLKVDITFVARTGDVSQEIHLYLNSLDMIGNPYQLSGFTKQEKLFDISTFTECAKIKKVVLTFYQKDGSFKDKNGRKLDYNYSIGQPPINPNLFIQNIYFAMGYDLGAYNDESIKILTDSTSTYKYIAGETIEESFNSSISENNHKQLTLSWIHKFENKFREVSENQAISYKLTWYRKNAGAKAVSPIVGEDWEILSVQAVNVNDNTGKINIEYKIEDKDIIAYNDKPGNLKIQPEFNKAWLIPNPKNKEEQVKAVVEYGDNQVLVSNTLVFENIGQILTEATKHQVSALTINCEDGSFGNYLLYRKDGKIIDESQVSIERQLKLYFKEYSENEDEISEAQELLEADSVEWIIPKDSMIKLKGYNDSDKTYYHPNDLYGKEFKISEEDGCFHITSSPLQSFNIIPYYIKRQLSLNNSGNNTIQAKITKNGYQYDAFLDMTFAVAGNAGTDFTFYLEFDKERALSINKNNSPVSGLEQIKVRAFLLDYNGKDITNLYQDKINWEWVLSDYNSDAEGSLSSVISINSNEGPKNEALLKLQEGLTEVPNNAFNILRAKINMPKSGDDSGGEYKEYELKAHLPIPIRLNYEDDHLSGTTEVRYNSLGSLDDMSYFQSPYQIFDEVGKVKPSVIWELSEESNDLAKISAKKIADDSSQTDYYFVPSVIYCSGPDGDNSIYDKVLALGKDSESKKIIWSQPVYMYQNRYPSSILDEWDGEAKVDAENNVILAAKIAAGRKNPDNSFSGVILGDWRGKTGLKDSIEESFGNYTGLYGFNYGKAAYGFRDDGTAFIGESGRGRMVFDGNSSTITSESYEDSENPKGMKMDLDDGYIHMTNEGYDISIDSTEAFLKNNENETVEIVPKHGPDWHLSGNNEFLDYYLNGGAPLKIGEKNKEKFKVFWDGTFLAQNGIFDGGTLWMRGNDGKNIILDSFTDTEGYPFIIGDKFKVKWDGTLEATGATFSNGSINVKNGNRRIILDPLDTSYPFKIGDIDEEKFKVSWDGTLEASGAKFTDGSVILNNGSSKITLDSDLSTYPFTIGDNFKVSWDGNLEGRKAMFEESSIQGEYGKIGSLTGTRILIDEGSCFLNQFSPNMNTNRISIHKKFEIKYLLQYYKNGKWNPLHEAIKDGYQLNEDLMFGTGSGENVDIDFLEEKLKELKNELKALNEQLAKDEADFEADPKVIELQKELKSLEAQLENSSGDTMALEKRISYTKTAISKIRKDYVEVTMDEIKLKKEAITSMEKRIQNAQSQNDAIFDKETSIFTDVYDYSYKFNKDTHSVESKFNEGNLPSLGGYYLIEITEDNKEEIYSETLAWFLNSIEAKEDDSRGLIGLLPGITTYWTDNDGDGSKETENFEATHNIGIQASSDANIVIEGGPHERDLGEGEMGAWIRLGNQDKLDRLMVSIKPENQKGIYARFA